MRWDDRFGKYLRAMLVCIRVLVYIWLRLLWISQYIPGDRDLCPDEYLTPPIACSGFIGSGAGSGTGLSV